MAKKKNIKVMEKSKATDTVKKKDSKETELLLDDEGMDSDMDSSIDSDDDIDFDEDLEKDLSLEDDGETDEEKQDALAIIGHNPPQRFKDSLQTYLREINRFPLLKPEEELELAKRVQKTGDPDAAFRLVSSHLRLVVRIAMGFQRRWMQNVLDLIQEGNVGLVRAVDKFDPDKGIKFSYYASFWIRAYILKFIMDNWRLVKLGTTQTQRKLFYNLNKERRALMAEGYNPDSEMLADRLDVSEDDIIEMKQRLDAPDMSLDAPVSDESGDTRTKIDFMPALGAGIEEILNNNQMAQIVRERLKEMAPDLNDTEKYILEHRLLTDDPLTLREIGEVFSITRERVRQVEARLLQKVRDHLVSNVKDFSREWIE